MNNDIPILQFGFGLLVALCLLYFCATNWVSKEVVEVEKPKRFVIERLALNGDGAYVIKDATTGLEYLAITKTGIIELKGKSTNE